MKTTLVRPFVRPSAIALLLTLVIFAACGGDKEVGADVLKGFADQGKTTQTNFDWATGSMGKFGTALGSTGTGVAGKADTAKTAVDALGTSITNLKDKTVTVTVDVTPTATASGLAALVDRAVASALAGLKTGGP